jgi:hypothetical protein
MLLKFQRFELIFYLSINNDYLLSFSCAARAVNVFPPKLVPSIKITSNSFCYSIHLFLSVYQFLSDSGNLWIRHSVPRENKYCDLKSRANFGAITNSKLNNCNKSPGIGKRNRSDGLSCFSSGQDGRGRSR